MKREERKRRPLKGQVMSKEDRGRQNAKFDQKGNTSKGK